MLTPPRCKQGRPMTLLAGPWEVTVRDKRGRKVVWRDGVSWNFAQRLAKNARRANYRRPEVRRMKGR